MGIYKIGPVRTVKDNISALCPSPGKKTIILIVLFYPISRYYVNQKIFFFRKQSDSTINADRFQYLICIIFLVKERAGNEGKAA